MGVIQFSQTALTELRSFKSGNQKLIFKVLDLLADIQKNPSKGLVNPIN
jgi:Txe/YoeB family toxin of Txe-Axe toxin-antitoxin module